MSRCPPPILEDVHIGRRLAAFGHWVTNRAWSRAGAVAQVLATHPARRALGMGTRVAMLLAGSCTIAVSVSFLLWNDFGPGPLDVFIGALRNLTGLPLMFAVWMTIGTLSVVAWALGRRPGFGTLIGPLITGPVMQLCLSLLERYGAPQHLAAKVVVHLLAIGSLGVGAGLVINAGLGSGTGELLAAAASDRSGRPEPRMRMLIESTWLVLGVVLGGPIGLGTVLVALAIGPSVARGHRMVGSVLTVSRRQLTEARLALA
jgi:uncharacterized membrane protein YczE